MLRRLFIERFALIDRLELEIKPGFTVVTGETGAGKSIFLGALQLALGGRAEFANVGQPGRKCVVEAEFWVPDSRSADLSSEDWDWWTEGSQAQLLLRRELNPGGRSRAFINDAPVRLDELRRVSSALVDIHSQRDDGIWAQDEGMILLLEAFAPDGGHAARESYRAAWNGYRDALAAKEEVESELGSVTDPDYLQYVVQELRAFQLKQGEEHELKQRLQLHSSQQELQESSAEALGVIDRDELGLESLASQVRRLGERAHRLGGPEQLASLGLALEESVRGLRMEWEDFAANLDTDPQEFARLEARMDELDRLLRKHQCADEDALRAQTERLESRLRLWSEGQERRRLAQEACGKALQEVLRAGELRDAQLQQAIPQFVHAIQQGLADLAMPQSRLAVVAEPRQHPHVLGTVRYRMEFSANPGHAMQELHKVASGGERSRLMLVLKRYLAVRQGLSTVLFDEIDTGVSGGTATKMAQMLRGMSQNAQVLAITHLPQVAALGSHHWVVEKTAQADATQTSIRVLGDLERPAEVARLLSDGVPSSLAIAQAEALMAAAE